MDAVTKFTAVSVPFDGEGPAVTAVMGGHADFAPVGSVRRPEHQGWSYSRTGRGGFSSRYRRCPACRRSPEYPDFAKYLPWGPFYGVFVRKDTPEDIKAALVSAFKKAAENAQFQQLMADRGNLIMNISGTEAEAFLTKWQSTTSWLLQDVGAANLA